MKTLLLSAKPPRSISVPDKIQKAVDPAVQVDLPVLDLSVLPELEEFLAQMIASRLLAKSVEHGGSSE